MSDADKSLKAWVSDRLHALLGFSDKHVVSYLVGVAKKHHGPPTVLATKLQNESGLPKGADTLSFCSEILDRLSGSYNSQKIGVSAAQGGVRSRYNAVSRPTRMCRQYEHISSDDELDNEEQEIARERKERERESAAAAAEFSEATFRTKEQRRLEKKRKEIARERKERERESAAAAAEFSEATFRTKEQRRLEKKRKEIARERKE
eukprot:CAMPEP_0175057942 /NCGR_PEP_ID=MMETSP0052_2-20121109/11551_1 /TAXON_ID=51329 ORGANISM="Polytomella parva, Strain SAG 63-3" /NCGR_SAMPLE_ID=MMETSP0052_2 /ASSEMBLY_ACC=CAM_ASM_000194 /LENGTH=205 /DNA_ID=CAMNT_0016323225 /DNA_START=75 /DNA_END=689 /DNA_ORIENTATION=-